MVCNLIHRQSLELSFHQLSLHHKQARPEQQPEEQSSMTSNILRASHGICVTAAIESIDIVALRHEQTKKTAGLDWYNVYYRMITPPPPFPFSFLQEWYMVMDDTLIFQNSFQRGNYLGFIHTQPAVLV